MSEMCQCGHLRDNHGGVDNLEGCHLDCDCVAFVLAPVHEAPTNPASKSKSPAERIKELCTCGHERGEHKDSALECYGNGDTCECERFNLAAPTK